MEHKLTELRMDAFKSVRASTITLNPVTLIVGRNGSGKSNVFDALAVLASLATGANLRDALDGGREGPVVRGGSQGCAPLGTSSFSIGCSADVDGDTVHLDVEIQIAPVLQIRSERLWLSSRPRPIELLATEAPEEHSADIMARWHNGKRGVNPSLTLRADQLLTTQVATRVPATTQAGKLVHRMAEGLLDSIKTLFLLDPVPHQMREYVPVRDNVLRRNADNLSAALRRLLEDHKTREALLSMTRSLSEAQVDDLTTISSELGDVMLTLTENIGGVRQPVSARLMSDGTLRFLAIVSALLDPVNPARSDSPHNRLVAVEELENGLHPSQAELLLRFLKESANQRGVRTIATTHSPAILDALQGSDHSDVVVCTRDPEGWTTVTRLTDFPDYFEIVGRHSLGISAIRDDIRSHGTTPVASPTLDLIFGR